MSDAGGSGDRKKRGKRDARKMSEEKRKRRQAEVMAQPGVAQAVAQQLLDAAVTQQDTPAGTDDTLCAICKLLINVVVNICIMKLM